MNPIARFAKNILLSIDQFGNVLLLGSPDETISARTYRRGELDGSRPWAIARKLVDALFWFEPDHTALAYRAEQDRCHMPEAYQHPNECDAATTSEKPE